MIYTALTQFKIRCNLRVSPCQIWTPKISKTKVLSQSGPEGINGSYDYGQRSIVCLFFLFSPSLTSSINLFYNSLYPNKSLTTKKTRTTFIRIALKISFKRPVFAMAVLQAPFVMNSLIDWLILFILCVIYQVSSFYWKVWYRWTCQVSHVMCHYIYFFSQSSEASQGSVCYQQCLPRLVSFQ